MAATVTGVQPLTPVQVPLEIPAPELPKPSYGEGGNNGSAAGIPINNGLVPDNFYGLASPGAGTGVKPTVVNATQGAAAQDDFAALNATSSSAGKSSDLTKSYSSTSFTPPPITTQTTAFGIPATGTNSPAAAYAGGTTYAKGAVVLATDGNAYQSIVASNVGNTPQSSPTKWNVLAGNPVTQGPGGGLGSAANPALLPLWTSSAILQNAQVGYISVNSSYRVAAAYAGGTTYAAGTAVIATDNQVYFSLQASNVGNDPTLTANQGVYWQQTDTTWDSGTNYIKARQTLLDGVLYVCVSAVTSNRPDVDSTDWGSGVTTVNPWISATTYSINNVVEYNNSVYISLANSNHDQIPGTQTGTTTGVAWWAELPVAPWNSYTNYLAGQYVTYTAATTGVTTLYLAQAGKNPLAQNPRVNNTMQINSDSTQDNVPTTALWAPIGYGVIAPYIAIAATTNNLPDANNQYVGTATWWKYMVGAGNTAFAAPDSQLGRAAISYPPLRYAEGTEFTNWQMGSYFGPAAIDSPTSRTDFSTIVAKIVINLPATFAHTTTGYATVTITDNNGNLLVAGQRGIPPLVVSSATATNITATAVEGNTFLLTGVLAGTSVITASVGNTRSATATMTVS